MSEGSQLLDKAYLHQRVYASNPNLFGSLRGIWVIFAVFHHQVENQYPKISEIMTIQCFLK